MRRVGDNFTHGADQDFDGSDDDAPGEYGSFYAPHDPTQHSIGEHHSHKSQGRARPTFNDPDRSNARQAIKQKRRLCGLSAEIKARAVVEHLAEFERGSSLKGSSRPQKSSARRQTPAAQAPFPKIGSGVFEEDPFRTTHLALLGTTGAPRAKAKSGKRSVPHLREQGSSAETGNVKSGRSNNAGVGKLDLPEHWLGASACNKLKDKRICHETSSKTSSTWSGAPDSRLQSDRRTSGRTNFSQKRHRCSPSFTPSDSQNCNDGSSGEVQSCGQLGLISALSQQSTSNAAIFGTPASRVRRVDSRSISSAAPNIPTSHALRNSLSAGGNTESPAGAEYSQQFLRGAGLLSQASDANQFVTSKDAGSAEEFCSSSASHAEISRGNTQGSVGESGTESEHHRLRFKHNFNAARSSLAYSHPPAVSHPLTTPLRAGIAPAAGFPGSGLGGNATHLVFAPSSVKGINHLPTALRTPQHNSRPHSRSSASANGANTQPGGNGSESFDSSSTSGGRWSGLAAFKSSTGIDEVPGVTSINDSGGKQHRSASRTGNGPLAQRLQVPQAKYV